MTQNFSWLRCDERTSEFDLWTKWLKAVPRFRDGFSSLRAEDDPLLYNETASVGVLASAASRSGLLALSEYSAAKRGTSRGRPLRNGRCDLWLQDPVGRRAWSFEFKQCFHDGRVRSGTLLSRLGQACKDADAVHAFEADRRFGGLLVSTTSASSPHDHLADVVDEISDGATFVCRLGGGVTPVWMVLLDIKGGAWRKLLPRG